MNDNGTTKDVVLKIISDRIAGAFVAYALYRWYMTKSLKQDASEQFLMFAEHINKAIYLSAAMRIG